MANDVGPLWYNTGTATVAQGDTVVTFQDEGNLYDIVRAGDDFGAHVQRPTRIKSIDQANSQATLAYSWPGPSQTAAPYEISFNPQISAYRIAVRTILGLLKSGNVPALAGLTGEADTMPYFTGPGQMGRTGLTPAARGILGLSGAANKLYSIDNQGAPGLADFTGLARTLLGRTNASDMRSTLDIDPIAAKKVRLDGGDDCNNLAEGFYEIGSDTPANAPMPYCVLISTSDANQPFQIAFGRQSGRWAQIALRRRDNSTWSGWTRMGTIQGNNSNGWYWKDVSGWQVCVGEDNTSSGGDVTWVYPSAFAAPPTYMSIGPTTSASQMVSAFFRNAVTATSCPFAGYRSAGRYGFSVTMMAYGRSSA